MSPDLSRTLTIFKFRRPRAAGVNAVSAPSTPCALFCRHFVIVTERGVELG
jgi:hypothetical protein